MLLTLDRETGRWASNQVEVSRYLEKNSRISLVPLFLGVYPGKIGFEKFYFSAIRDFIKKLRINHRGTNKIEGQADVFLTISFFFIFLTS